MSTLPNILPTMNVATFASDAATGSAGSSVDHGEAFDELMHRALAPTDSKNNPTAQTTSPVPTPTTATPDFSLSFNPVKTAATKTPANQSKKTDDQIKSTSTGSADDKTATVPLPADLIIPQISVPVEINSAPAVNIVVVNTINDPAKNVAAIIGQPANVATTPQKNVSTTGTPVVDAISSEVVNDDKAANVANAVMELLSASAPAAVKNIANATTQVSDAGNAPTQTVADPSTLPNISIGNTAIEATGDPTVSAAIADDTVTVVSTNAVAATVETAPEPVMTPVVPTNSTATNQPVEKTSSKIKMDSAGRTGGVSTTNTMVADVKTGAPTNVTVDNGGSANPNTDDAKTAKATDKTSDEKLTDTFSQPTLFSGTTTAQTTASPPLTTDGTPTAKQDDFVGGDQKASKNEGSTGKILPGSGAPVMRGNDLPVRTEPFATNAATIAATQDNPTATTTTVERLENPAAADLNLQTMERTHELVALHAMRLSDVNTGTMQVVIKPEAGTQLSLELRQRGNGIEAQAVLQQGDFKHLNQHWPELQQRLEQRGIKLASLTDSGIAGNGGGGGRFEQKQNQSVEAFTGYASTGSVTGTFTPVKPRVTTHQGWETWA